MNLGRLAISLPAPGLDPRSCIAVAQKAEREWGYDAIWLAETNGPDSFALGGALATATENAVIGTAIVPVYNRTPAVLAMSAATVQQLSGGRFVLGLGSSSHAIMRDWNGVAFEKPLAHVRESVAILRQALAGEKTDFDGEAFRSKGFRLGNVPRQPVPIYLAALREKMLRLAGAIGDGLIVNLFPSSALPQILGAYRSGGAEAGRDVTGHEVVCRFQVLVTDDLPYARNLVRMAFGGYMAAAVYNKFLAWCGFEDEMRAVADAFARKDRAGVGAAMSDDLIDRITILGPAERCREQLAEFVAMGVTTPVLSPLALDRRAVEAVFETFAPARAGS